MGILRFFRRLNCFGSAQGKLKSKRAMEKELSNMYETIKILKEDIETTICIVELCKQRQRAAEEKQEMTRNNRSHLMAQVEQIGSRLGRVLEKRQELMSEIIECGIRKMTLERKLQAMENKANFFWNDLNYPTPDPRKSAKRWQENLREVRSMNDLNKAVPQPPLCPSQDFVEDDFPIWEVPGDSSDDDGLTEILKNENYEESLIITEPFF